MLHLGHRYRVEELVPQRGTMCLLESIDDYGDSWLQASLSIRPDSAFAGAAGVPGWLCIEYMAQAAAAFAGLEQVQAGEFPSIGLLIGTRYYHCMFDVIPIGSRISVHVKIALRDSEDFAAYECTLSSGGQIFAECTLKAYRPHDLQPWLKMSARG
jgi:predicted hotdog family 3-hydroxylacyl-ACP dehydratase